MRARGYVSGEGSSSSWFVESTGLSLRLRLTREDARIVLNWTGGQGPYQVQKATNLSQPDGWENVGPLAHTNSVALPLGPDSLFLRVRGQ